MDNIKYSIKSMLFLGVGGISMYQLAIEFKKLGIDVLGYDAAKNDKTILCKKNGIKVTNKFNPKFCNVDICVRSSAINEFDEYVKYLKYKNIQIIDRGEALGWLCSKFKTVIAIAGSHGKSTTSDLIYEILRFSGRAVSCHIGADLDNYKFDFKDDYLVVEACEYKNNFLYLYPNITVVTNVEAEHLDYFKNMFNLRNSFIKFLKRGQRRYVFSSSSVKFLKKYKNITFVEKDKDYETKLIGEYNQNNIALATKVCLDLGVDEEMINRVVKNYSGIKRRNEYIGTYGKTKIFADYAHHPSEIICYTSSFLKNYPKALIVFQPHTYSRTELLFDDFVNALSTLENLCIFKEYQARERANQGKSARQLFESVLKNNYNVSYCENIKQLKSIINKYDCVAFVGAGDIYAIAKKFVKTN